MTDEPIHTVTAKPPLPVAPQRVTVTDVQMPFGSMVIFMIKWAFAAIPAIIVIVMVTGALTIFFGGLFTALVTSPLSKARATSSLEQQQPVDGPIPARNLRGFSYSQVVERIGVPSSQTTGRLFYEFPDGRRLTVVLKNDRVVTVDPEDLDLRRLSK
jgi:hypothetical protein